MYTTRLKHIGSALSVALFFTIAVASSHANKLECGAFNADRKVEKSAGDATYVVLNDGKIINGNKIKWTSGLLAKDQVKIDDQKFKTEEVKGYQNEGAYYARYKKVFAKRIIKGRLNVYLYRYTEVNTTTNSRGMVSTQNEVHCNHYVQIGDTGELTPLTKQEDIKAVIESCPKAVEMLNINSKETRKAIRHDPNFLNGIFDVYNNGCK